MKCPLFMAVWGQHSANVVMNYPECLKGECAWWDNEEEQCCLLTVGQQVHWLVDALDRVEKKMLSEGVKSGKK